MIQHSRVYCDSQLSILFTIIHDVCVLADKWNRSSIKINIFIGR